MLNVLTLSLISVACRWKWRIIFLLKFVRQRTGKLHPRLLLQIYPIELSVLKEVKARERNYLLQPLMSLHSSMILNGERKSMSMLRICINSNNSSNKYRGLAFGNAGVGETWRTMKNGSFGFGRGSQPCGASARLGFGLQDHHASCPHEQQASRPSAGRLRPDSHSTVQPAVRGTRHVLEEHLRAMASTWALPRARKRHV